MNNVISIEQWHQMWQGLGIEQPDDKLFYKLVSCYSEQHRRYHTMQHLYECFAQFAKIHTQAIHPKEIELALWFHDAIYEVQRHDNEERSAAWAQSSILHTGLPDIVGQRVYDLVMVTKHHVAPIEHDAKIMVDIDLAILGSSSNRFDEYECQIRQEYSWVPELEFRSQRLRILEAISKRTRIFNTEYFQQTHEGPARENLRRSAQRYRNK